MRCLFFILKIKYITIGKGFVIKFPLFKDKFWDDGFIVKVEFRMADFVIREVYLVSDEQTPAELEEKLAEEALQRGWNYKGVVELQSVYESYDPEGLYLLSLSDFHLKDFLSHAEGGTIGLLPHPEAVYGSKRFQIESNLTKALNAIAECSEPRVIDNLYCNDVLVLSSVLAGDREAMEPATKMQQVFLARLLYLWKLMLHMVKSQPFGVGFTTDKDSQLQTAALGLCIVYQPSDNAFSHRVVANSEVNDPSLHAVIFAPRSISEILHFIVTRLLPFQKKVLPLTNYLGHIKTPSLKVQFQKSIEVRLDNQEAQYESLECTLKPSNIRICHQSLPNERIQEPKESFRVSSLPRGKLLNSLISLPLPWIYHADLDEVKETFVNLKDSARLSQAYLVLMALSALLATVGLFANSAPVIIGAMILAPLMAPIISLSMGVLRQEVDLTVTSSKTLLFGALLALFGAAIFSWLMPLQSLNSEITARLSPTLLDLAVAIVSGVAGAYASAKSEVAKSLAGVAIAVALVPPLAVSGIGIGWWDWQVFSGSFLLFLTNLVGIILAAAATFLVMGFSPLHLAKRGLLMSLGVVLVVSIPLSMAFYSMVQEQKMVSSLEGLSFTGIESQVTIRNVQIRRGDPLEVSVTMVSDRTLNTEELDKIKADIEQRLGRKIRLQASLSLLR